MNTLLQEFINESRELLEEASQAFLHLENNPDDLNILNSLFRAIHTIKGSSGLFDIAPLTNVVHAAEDVLDIVREGRLKLSPDMVDILLDSLDQVNTWLDDLEAEEKLSPDAEEISEELKTKLRGMITNFAQEEGGQKTDNGHETELASSIDWLAKISEEDRQGIVRQAQNLNDTLLTITYIPDEQCFFNGDDPLYTMRQIPELCWFGIETREPWPDINEFDPFTCLVQFYALTRASLEEIKELFTYVEEEVQQTRISVQDLIFPQGDVGDNEPFGLFVQDATKLIDDKDWSSLLKVVDVALEVAGPDLFQASALRWLKVVLEHPSGPNESLIKNLVQAVATGIMPEGEVVEEQEENNIDYPQEKEQKNELTTKLALDILRTQQKLLQLPCTPELWTGRLLSIGEVLKRSLPFSTIEKSTEEISALIDKAQKEKNFSPLLSFINDILSSKDSTEPEPIRKEPEKQAPVQQETEKKPVVKPSPPVKQTIKVLKVDQKRIDVLMDLVSELVVAKNSLPFLAKRAEEVFQSREMAKELKTQYGAINRICEELQTAVMQVRMVPVSHVFQRFPRLVRDLSRRLGKKVRLIIEGEETEADKNVVEDLAEPLVHLLRNSIDHGIEPPEERETLGKPIEGEVRLRAIHLEDQVVIEISDDGRGIDPEIVKRKAYEKGLINEEKLDQITEEEALQLIFAPGLSTAEQVSDVSGRGVGMDAVRTMVEKAGGSISIKSEKGRGTVISLSLPLTMAVTRVLMIEVGGEIFGVPIESVMETVRVPANDIHLIKNKETVILRNRLIPLCRLGDVLQLSTQENARKETEEEAILVVNTGREELGLIVDKFHEGVDIILKPLEGLMAKFRIYAGATLLGDGRVLLVLNLKELVKCL